MAIDPNDARQLFALYADSQRNFDIRPKCQHCGERFEANHSGRHRVYCGDRCRRGAAAEARRLK